MLEKTKAIVIGTIKYGESSIIAKIFTEKFGLLSFIINGVRNVKSSKSALYQPLSQLELDIYYKNGKDLLRIKDVKNIFPYQSIPYQQDKIGITLFISEILNKILKQEASEIELFQLTENTLQYLDLQHEDYQNVHITFLFKLSNLLGIHILSTNHLCLETNTNFTIEEKTIINNIIENPIHHPIKINSQFRSRLLDTLLTYYQFHINDFNQLNSIKILRELNN